MPLGKRSKRIAGVTLAVLTGAVVAAALGYGVYALFANRFRDTRQTFVRQTFASSPEPAERGQTCSQSTCGALDPVTDPRYNMKEIAKQSLLLEDHLLEPAKRCAQCIAKHFLTLVALAEEAVSLAGPDIERDALMAGNPQFYDDLMKRWLADRAGSSNLVAVAADLRARRKVLVDTYVLGDQARH